MVNRSLFQNIYLFKRMSGEELDLIAKLGISRTLQPGELIFQQGEKATALYVIKYGSVRILQKSTLGDDIEVATLGTGSHFGEMSFVDGEPRSATARAAERSEIIELRYEQLAQALEQYPAVAVSLYKELSHFLCGRLRITTNDLSFAREKNLSHF